MDVIAAYRDVGSHAVRRPRVPVTEAAYLTPDQVRLLLLAAKSSRCAPLFELLVNTGLRRGEALALHWSDIDLDAKLLRVRGTLARVAGKLIVTETKTPKSRRVVPLSPTAERLLREVRANQRAERLRTGSMWQPTPYVITTELGEPCDRRNALRALKAAAKRARLPSSVGLHTLRHSSSVCPSRRPMILDPLDEADRAYMKGFLQAPVRMLYPFLIGRPWKK